LVLRDRNQIWIKKEHSVTKMFGEDEKSLAGDLANYNWKIFACSVVFDNIFTNGWCDWARLLRALIMPIYGLVPCLLISFRFAESRV